MSPEPVRVLVVYSHALLGEGLGRMLAAEPDMVVDAVDSADAAAVDAAIARQPGMIVVEEGGAVDAAEIVRRSQCPVVLDVDITSTHAWTLRRESISSRPEEFLAAIRSLVGNLGQEGPDPGVPVDRETLIERPADVDRRTETERALRAVVVPG